MNVDNCVSKAFEKEVVNTFSLHFHDFFAKRHRQQAYNLIHSEWEEKKIEIKPI